ncbi:hypothetical protein AVEN_58558-1 [Araneus ventricosus]|uniref:DUF7041 domain-containing protein n=1 Tax=Araneus ventricosus TaxID=182803 RepID=A0A4Y2BQW4_ARAVE|nr:hypothetical protein AVEN_58558-1 [Araneus ventricosus]
MQSIAGRENSQGKQTQRLYLPPKSGNVDKKMYMKLQVEDCLALCLKLSRKSRPVLSKILNFPRIAFKAPVFWENDPEFWFFQVESQFVIAGISNDSTKFHAVAAALNSNVLSCVRDIVRNPPLENAYIALKDRVLQHFAQSSSARLNLLLNALHIY